MESTSRRHERKAKLRTRILDAASQLFAVHGYENVTLRAIAEEIGYSHAVLYQYFPDKSHILSGICQETFALLIEDFDRIAAASPNPKDRLFDTTRGMVKFCLDHPQHCRIVFFGPEDRNGVRVGDYIDEIGKPLFDRFQATFRKCLQESGLEIEDARLAALTWWCSLLGLAFVLIIQGKLEGFPAPEFMVEQAISMMWAGLNTSADIKTPANRANI